MEKRNAFRKRSNAVVRSGAKDCHYHVKTIGDKQFVSLICDDASDELKLPAQSPTLDEQLHAGVSVKEVDVSCLMDSYDVNDTPLEQIQEKIVTKGRKKKSEPSPDSNE